MKRATTTNKPSFFTRLVIHKVNELPKLIKAQRDSIKPCEKKLSHMESALSHLQDLCIGDLEEVS